MKAFKRWLHLGLVFCLAFGWAFSIPLVSPTAVLADDSPPPAEESGLAPQVEASPLELTPEEIEIQAAMDALELARQAGPEAVLTLYGMYHGKALDLLMDDIQKARAELVRSAPPLPETAPVSPQEEEAIVQAQLALDAAEQPQPLVIDPALTLDENPAAEPAGAETSGDAKVDRTVGSPPCTYATILAAMNAASNGDRLLLEGDRVFYENLSVQKSLTFQGGYAGCGSGSTALTTIDAGGSGRGLYIYQNLTVTLENLNIINASTTAYGAGIFVHNNSQVTGNNVHIYNNTTSDLGGGVFLYGATATFTNSNIYNNTAVAGAGVYGMLFNAIPSVLNLPSYADVYGNNALTSSGLGGGVYMDQGTVSLADCSDIYSNHAILGGGAYLATSTLTVAGDCSEIMLNTATGNGGGVYALTSTVNLDEQAELYSNQAGYGGGAGSGGGAYLDASDLWGDKALIIYNTATTNGGGVYATNSSLLDMDLGGLACTGPRCSQLSYNTATNLYGGGVYATTTSEIDLRQVFIESNSAQYGGGVYIYQGPLYLYNNLLARNNASGGVGDGLRIYTGSTMTGQHNTLANNDASGATTGAAISASGATLTLSNSIIWNHTSSIDLVGQTVTCSDIQGGYTGTGNLNVNPLFIDPASSNFHLQSTSPVIDTCASGQAFDFDNEARPVIYKNPAAPYDMGADEASKRVGINGAGCAYGRIQDAVDAAVSGDTIQAKEETFVELVTVTAKNLTIAGGYDADCKTDLDSHTTVDAANGGRVFTVTDSLLTLHNLTLTGGNTGNGGGLALLSSSTQVTLEDTDIRNNQASNGGGVYIGSGALLTLMDDSDISNNNASLAGGGARVWGSLLANDWNSSISYNTSLNGGGVSVPGGTLDLAGSQIMYNQANPVSGLGGGIHAYNVAMIHVSGSSNIAGNSAFNGGGIYADAASLSSGLAVIHSNTALNYGGGVYLANASSLDAVGTYIGHDATASRGNDAVFGAGLYVVGSTLTFDGHIINNIANQQGGGIYASGATLNLSNCQVGGVSTYHPNQLGPDGHTGAGLFLTAGTQATLTSCDVSSNAFQTTGFTYGGGAYVEGASSLTLVDSTIQLHQAPSADDGRGAGLYVRGGSTVTLDNSDVMANTAGWSGGGIRLFETTTLNILNDSQVSDNHATNSRGGAIDASGTPDINITGSRLEDNSAGTDGGAVYLDAGTLDFSGWWTISGNTAGRHGGGLAVSGTGDAGFNSNTAGSSILNNTATGNGGGLYLNNTTTLQLYSTSGYLLSLSGNSAGGNGGAAYADGGGYFDVYGRVVITANRAALNGGAFYLSNGSRVWFDDYVNDALEIRVNWAQNGGAIYAQDSPIVECDGASFGYEPEGNYTTTGSGGAIYLLNSTFNADNCTFLNNLAAADGGAIAAYTSTLNIYASYPGSKAALERADSQEALSPQDIKATACNPLTGPCSGLYGNMADSDGNAVGNGGAIFSSDSNLSINATYLHHNAATRGGAIYQQGAAAVANVTNTLIYSNTVSVALGAGIRSAAGTFNLTHTTLADNVGGSGFSGTVNEVRNTIAWGNSAPGFTVTPLVAACNIDDGGLAGLNLDPQFRSPGAGEDYHLLATSPAINACGAGLSPDLDNVPRPFGSAYDMGAFEFNQLKVFLPVIVR